MVKTLVGSEAEIHMENSMRGFSPAKRLAFMKHVLETGSCAGFVFDEVVEVYNEM